MSATDPTHHSILGAQRASIETLYRAFNEQKPELVDAVLAPDWDDIPLAPGQAAGPEGLKEIIRMLGEAIPDLRLTLLDMVHETGKASVRAELSGTHQGTLFGIPATGLQVRIPMQEFHSFKDGLIIRTWHIEDWFGMFQQLHQFPPKA